MFKIFWLLPALIIPIAVLSSFAVSFNLSEFVYIDDYNYIFIVLGIVFGLYFFYKLFIINETAIEFNIIDVLIILFIGYIFVRKALMPGSFYSLSIIYLLLLLICYYITKEFIRVNLISKQKISVDFLNYLFLSLALIQLLHGLLQFIGLMPNYENSPFKIGGAFMNPGAYANFVIVLLPFSLVCALYNQNKFLKYYSYVILLLSIIMLGLSNARTAWIAGVIIIIIIINRKFKLIKRIVSLNKLNKILLISSIIILLFASAYVLYNLKRNSANGRVFIWQNSIHLISQKPLFGSGYNMFYKAINDYQAQFFSKNKTSSFIPLSGDVKYAFNDFLEITVNLGIFGLLFFLSLLFTSLRVPIINKDISPQNVNFLYSAKLSIIAILITSLFSYPLNIHSILILFYFNIAVLSASLQKPLKVITFHNYSIKLIFGISFMLAVFFEYYHIQIFQAFKKWKKAVDYVDSRQLKEANILFNEIEPKLNFSYEFLFNYGNWYRLQGDYFNAIRYLEKSAESVSNKDLYIALGDCYQGLNELKKAEACYIKAGNFMPYLFTPKYELFKLYKQTKDTQNALFIANELLGQEIKIYSPVIGEIKAEAFKYINNHKTD